MNCKSFLISFALLIALSNCASWLPDAHKIDIPQGNNLEESQIKKLKNGLTKEQVLYLLGNSVTTPNKKNDTWVYLYYLVKAGMKPEKIKQLKLKFKANKLVYFESSLL